jgi:hypothetical protein
MIRCRREHLEERCRQRGYALAQALPCILLDHGNGWVTVDESHKAYPREKPGLGDMVATGLSAVGVTKERVSKALGRPCGCGKRQAKLNELGRRIGIG